MNQKGNALLITVIAIIVIVGGWMIYNQAQTNNTTNDTDDVMIKDEGEVMMNEEDKMMEEDKTEDTMMKEDETMMKEEGEVMMKVEGGEYIAYQPALLSRAEQGNVVLFFRAGWCPTCRILDNSLKGSLDNIPDDLTILDVDYDNSSELKNKYGVTYQHTLVQVDANGNQIAKWSGGSDLNSIVSHLK